MFSVDLYEVEKFLSPRGIDTLSAILDECVYRDGEYICSHYRLATLEVCGRIKPSALDELYSLGIILESMTFDCIVVKPTLVDPNNNAAIETWRENLAWR